MTEERFVVEKYSIRDMSIDEKYVNSSYYIGDKGIAQSLCDLLNGLHKENEQLKKDGEMLCQCIENQSIIIQGLHSELMKYQLKEPIILTKEDLELMGKAISYYTHGRYVE